MTTRRIVALGASNLTRGSTRSWPARAAWGADVEVLAALELAAPQLGRHRERGGLVGLY